MKIDLIGSAANLIVEIGDAAPKVLVPYDRREAMSLRQAAEAAGRSEATLRAWCGKFLIGRRIVGGRWEISRVALEMLMTGDQIALRAYLAGDRSGARVMPYFERAGLAQKFKTLVF